jgi:hypothetical protein
MHLTGGCFCRDVRYELAGKPSQETNCHCTMCRGTTGAPLVSWFSVARSEFRLTRGTPSRFRSSAQATRSFCGRCGTQLTFERDDLPLELDVTTCSLDQPELVPPRDHTWTSSQLPWIDLGDPLPRHPSARST